jgi:hypothetical protein
MPKAQRDQIATWPTVAARGKAEGMGHAPRREHVVPARPIAPDTFTLMRDTDGKCVSVAATQNLV